MAVPIVHPTAIIEEHVSLGRGTRVWALSQVRTGAGIGDGCNVGMGVFVDVDVRIGHRCKIQNHALIFHGSLVGDEVFIGPGACLTNDRNPRATTPEGDLKDLDDWTVSGVTLEQGCSIGAHAVVIGGVRVGSHAMVGAGAVVTRDVLAHALVVGTPARRIGWVCRCGQRLDADLGCPECRRGHRPAGNGIQETQESRA
jgi:UDP-2-acetamido-3-amino-2,3-dideoxy-glucuronate N-acetyltransferase